MGVTPGCDGAAWRAGSLQGEGATGSLREAGTLRGEEEARSSVIGARLRERWWEASYPPGDAALALVVRAGERERAFSL